MSHTRITLLLPLAKTTISPEIKRKISEDLYNKAKIAFHNAQTVSPLVIGEDDTQKKMTGYREKNRASDINPDECLKNAVCFLETAIEYDHQEAKTLLTAVEKHIRIKMMRDKPEYSLMLDELHIIEDYQPTNRIKINA